VSERCDCCEKEYDAIYWVPEHVWQKIRPSQEGYGGLLCVECAHARALRAGYTLRFSGSDAWWGGEH